MKVIVIQLAMTVLDLLLVQIQVNIFEYIDSIYKIKLCYAERSDIEWARSSAR